MGVGVGLGVTISKVVGVIGIVVGQVRPPGVSAGIYTYISSVFCPEHNRELSSKHFSLFSSTQFPDFPKVW
jgi:hypothetical protein